jgi:hypothetical protein
MPSVPLPATIVTRCSATFCEPLAKTAMLDSPTFAALCASNSMSSNVTQV